MKIYGNEDDPLKRRTKKIRGSKDSYDPAFERLQMYMPLNGKGVAPNFRAG